MGLKRKNLPIGRSWTGISGHFGWVSPTLGYFSGGATKSVARVGFEPTTKGL
jgi:hypothetical protein